MSNKALYILTSSFPYGDKEPVVQQEVDLLSKSFDKIIIICSQQAHSAQFKLPKNCKDEYFPSYTSNIQKLIFAFQLLTSSLFWNEIRQSKKTYKLPFSFLIFKTMLSAYTEARRFKKQLALLKRRLHLENYESYYYAWWARYQSIGLAMQKEQEQNAKLFIRMHGYDLYFERHPSNYLPFRSYIFEHATSILFISEQGKKYIQNKFQKDFSNHLVCRLGTNNEQDLKINTPTATLHVVSCSSLIPLKRIHLIIEALSMVSSDTQINWKHFGDGPLFGELNELAVEKIKNRANITYSFEGFIQNTKLLNYFSNNPVDLFINVSETEGIPISIMEAYSFGIPAIATDVGGVSELVNNDNGYLFPVDVPSQQIANTMSNFKYLSEEARLSKQQKSYEKWQAEYNSKKNITELSKKLLAASFIKKPLAN
jgi:glycosyltransferase involved in cell wall biosynthesis